MISCIIQNWNWTKTKTKKITKQKKRKTMTTSSFVSAIQATATPKLPKSQKPKIPTLEPPEEIKQRVDEFQEQKEIMKGALGQMRFLENDIISLVAEIQDKEGFNGNFHNSYMVPGMKNKVTVVFAEKYSINPEDEPELKQILGENYDKLFRQEITVKLKDEILLSSTLQEKLMSLVGEHFAEFFESQISVVPVPNYKELVYRYTTPKKLEKLRVFVRQAKPSLK
jgi:hypothetical protein